MLLMIPLGDRLILGAMAGSKEGVIKSNVSRPSLPLLFSLHMWVRERLACLNGSLKVIKPSIGVQPVFSCQRRD